MMRKLLLTLLALLFPRRVYEQDTSRLTLATLRACRSPRALGDDCDLVALFPYRRREVKSAVHALKYGNRRDLAVLLGAAAAEWLSEAWPRRSRNPCRIVPMPLAPSSRRVRGYNQAELIAQACAERMPHALCDASALARSDAMRQSRQENRRKRAQNIEAVRFYADASRVAGHDVVLLDDVATTGSTMRAARGALLEAGARSVLCLALAH